MRLAFALPHPGDDDVPQVRARPCPLTVVAGLAVAVAAAAVGCTATSPPSAFTRVVIDAATPGSLVEKAMADFNRDGRLDVAVGYRKSSQGAGGIYWHAFPASGRATDPWVKRTVVTPTDAYEDMVAHDVDRDGWVDLVASVDDQIRWFRNPGAGTTWTATTIGRSVGRGDMVIGDLDGDGRADVATNSDIFFQDSPAAWVRKGLGDSTVGIALFDSGSGLGSVDIVRSSPPPPTTWCGCRTPAPPAATPAPARGPPAASGPATCARPGATSCRWPPWPPGT